MFGILICALFFPSNISLISLVLVSALSVFPDFDLKFEHRKTLHNIFAAGVISYTFSFAFPMLPLSLSLASYFSHICLDMLSPAGVAIFYPLSSKRYRIFGKIRSGIQTLTFVIFLWAVFTYMGWVPLDKLLSVI